MKTVNVYKWFLYDGRFWINNTSFGRIMCILLIQNLELTFLGLFEDSFFFLLRFYVPAFVDTTFRLKFKSF